MGRNTALGGALRRCNSAGLEPVLSMGARAGSAGLLSAAGWKRLSGEVLESIAAGAKTGSTASIFRCTARWAPMANSTRKVTC